MITDLDIEDYVRLDFDPVSAGKVLTLLETLKELHLYDELSAVFSTYSVDVISHEVLPYPPEIRNHVKSIIIYYVVDELVERRIGVIVDKEMDISLDFVLATALWYANLTKYTSGLSELVLNDLNNDDYTHRVKIGHNLATYNPDYYPLDAENDLLEVPDSTIQELISVVEDTITVGTTDDATALEVINRLHSVDESLLATNLARYVITNNAYHMTGGQMLEHIDDYISNNDTTPMDQYKEFLTYGTLTHTTGADLRDVMTDTGYVTASTYVTGDDHD